MLERERERERERGAGQIEQMVVVLISFVLMMMVGIDECGAESMGSNIGAILDLGSRDGRGQEVLLEMAVEDYRNSTGKLLSLHVRDSQGDPILAASAAIGHPVVNQDPHYSVHYGVECERVENLGGRFASVLCALSGSEFFFEDNAFAFKDLIDNQRVLSILGFQTWLETAAAARLGEKAHVPICSFANSCPPWASDKWPFLLRVSHNQHTQMRALAAIIESWKWRRVAIIYEDRDYIAANSIPYLINAIEAVGSIVDCKLALPPFTSSTTEQLEKLSGGSCKVFIVHTSFALAVRLFADAIPMGMMTQGHAWILSNSIVNSLDSANPSTIALMQGAIGVRSYFPQETGAYDYLSTRFRTRLSMKYPEEANLIKIDISGLQKYDAVWALGRAIERTKTKESHDFYFQRENDTSTDQIPSMIYKDGSTLLDSLRANKFTGFSGEFKFAHGELAPDHTFQIINIIGKSYQEMGFWTSNLGFSKTMLKDDIHSTSMTLLGPVLWPGATLSAPRGRSLATSSNFLRIGVPSMSAFPDYVRVAYDDQNEPLPEGFSIDVFKAVVDFLPYQLYYKFIPFNGTYDSLVKQVWLKVFDAVVGDTSIVSYRYKHAEFTQAYTESGIMVVVPKKFDRSKAWIFIKPFRGSMWALIFLVSVYNALVLWLIERRSNDDFQGSSLYQIVSSLWLSFISLFSNGDRVQSNLSRAVMVVWLFLGLVLTSNYTASLSSMLTAKRLEPAILDVETLRENNEMVGCDKGSTVCRFLEEGLHFHPNNIKQFSCVDDYPQALLTGEIKAVFLKSPYAKLFLARYCKDFTTIDTVFQFGGFGFVFPKGSSLLPDFSKVIMKLFENGRMQKLEDRLLSSYSCSSRSSKVVISETELGPESFWGLFVIMGATSTISLLLFLCGHLQFSQAVTTFTRITRGSLLVKLLLIRKAVELIRRTKPWLHNKVADGADPQVQDTEMHPRLDT